MSIDLKTSECERERLLVNRRRRHRRSLALYNAKQAGDKTGCLVLVWSLSLTLRIVFIAAPHGPCQVYLLTKQALLTCLVPFLCLVTASRNITTVRKWTLLALASVRAPAFAFNIYKHVHRPRALTENHSRPDVT
jgi:hypothetical protein